MKELSIEEKAKRYDLAIEAAKSIYNNMEEGGNFSGIEDLEVIFPELAKSEDERMFKAIAEGIRDEAEVFGWSDFGDIPIDDLLAWLEKQREKTSDKIVEKARTEKQRVLLTETDGNANIDWDCRSINDVKLLLKCGLEFIRNIEANKQILTDNRFGDCSFRVPTWYNEGINQGEQKPTDKVEPKFKVGDWVVDEYVGNAWHIDSIDKKNYQVSNEKGNCNYFPILDQDKMHLWTIADAKPGDVLVNNKIVIIVDHLDTFENRPIIYSWYFTDSKQFYGIGPTEPDRWEVKGFIPATKEQRDLLFQKMKEAGYKWKNNQLEKINTNEDYVDLCLPSGTLWAKCNLGAEKETDFGLFFQWGDTIGYDGDEGYDFSLSTYEYVTPLNNITKYNRTDGKTNLDNEDDPVFVATNGKFKSPTKDQLQELIDNTNHEWTSIDGVNGMKFWKKGMEEPTDDDSYIFIPATGYCHDICHYSVGSWGSVWSASRNESYATSAWHMYFNNVGDADMNYLNRSNGYSVRGVLNK